MMSKNKLVYIDNRGMALMNMKLYGGNRLVLKKGAEFLVTLSEKKYLLKLKNGKRPMFRVKQERKEAVEIKQDTNILGTEVQ